MLDNNKLKQLTLDATQIVLEAGKITIDAFGKVNSFVFKDIRDFATKTDLDVEEFLRNKLSKLLPEAGFIVEEGETIEEVKYNWIIDPIDQTKSFASNLPMFFIQLALLENNVPILGIIYQPIANQLFAASLNNGTTLNGKLVSVNENVSIDKAIIDIDIRGKNDLSFKNYLFDSLLPITYRLRVSGGAFPIYLTTGYLDGYVKLYTESKKFDLLPRDIIFKETGFITEYIKSNNIECYIAANKNIFPVLKNILEESKINLVK